MPLNPGAVNSAYVNSCTNGKGSKPVRVKVGDDVFFVSGMDYHAAYTSCFASKTVDCRGAQLYLTVGRMQDIKVSPELRNMDYVDTNKWPEFRAMNHAARIATGEVTEVAGKVAV